MDKEIATRFREERVLKGVSTSQMAELFECSTVQLSVLERGITKLRIEKIEEASTFFGLDSGYIITGKRK